MKKLNGLVEQFKLEGEQKINADSVQQQQEQTSEKAATAYHNRHVLPLADKTAGKNATASSSSAISGSSREIAVGLKRAMGRG